LLFHIETPLVERGQFPSPEIRIDNADYIRSMLDVLAFIDYALTDSQPVEKRLHKFLSLSKIETATAI
jgi:hypothetical protein